MKMSFHQENSVFYYVAGHIMKYVGHILHFCSRFWPIKTTWIWEVDVCCECYSKSISNS